MQYHYSKAKLIGYIFLGAILFLGSWFCATRESTKLQFAGWLGIIFCVPLILALIPRLLMTKPIVAITETGIEDRRWGIGEIPWWDVALVEIQTVQTSAQTHQYIAIRLVNEKEYLGKLSIFRRFVASMNQMLGYAPFLVVCHALDADFTDVLSVTVQTWRNYSAPVTNPDSESGS